MAPHSSTPAWKIHGRRSLVGCSPWGCQESDTTEWLHFHFSLSCIREGNDNPLQCSCLENPRDGGAWWAAVSGVAQSWTRLKWLSSSSRMNISIFKKRKTKTMNWEKKSRGPHAAKVINGWVRETHVFHTSSNVRTLHIIKGGNLRIHIILGTEHQTEV